MAGIFIATLLLIAVPAYTQDIDEVMNGLDQDFKFGGKEDIKQNNKSNTNEALREDTAISNSQPGLVDVLFSIFENNMDNNSISVEIVGTGLLANGVDGNTVQSQSQLQPDSIHTLKVSCTGLGFCEFFIFNIKGALFIPSQRIDSGAFAVTLSGGSMQTFQFKVNKDNSAQSRPVPPPPPPVAS